MAREWSPTPRQKMVLRLLATNGAMTAPEVARQSFGISANTAWSIFSALGDRGLVDTAAGGTFSRGRYVRAFALTSAGAELERSLLGDDDDDGA